MGATRSYHQELLEIPRNHISKFVSFIHELQAASKEMPPLYQDISNTIRSLTSRHTIAIISSSSSESIAHCLGTYDLESHAAGIFGGETKLSKQERIAIACKQFEFAPKDSLMIGDSISDIRAGNDAGIRTVAVTWGFQPREWLIEESPDFIIDTPPELLQICSG